VSRPAAHVACAGDPSGYRYGLFETGQSEVHENVPFQTQMFKRSPWTALPTAETSSMWRPG
jgi:hypothetical protein